MVGGMHEGFSWGQVSLGWRRMPHAPDGGWRRGCLSAPDDGELPVGGGPVPRRAVTHRVAAAGAVGRCAQTAWLCGAGRGRTSRSAPAAPASMATQSITMLAHVVTVVPVRDGCEHGGSSGGRWWHGASRHVAVGRGIHGRVDRSLGRSWGCVGGVSCSHDAVRCSTRACRRCRRRWRRQPPASSAGKALLRVLSRPDAIVFTSASYVRLRALSVRVSRGAGCATAGRW